MGRKSSLTTEQWIEVERLVLLEGQSVNSVAKKYGVNEAAIRRKINPKKSEAVDDSKSLPELARSKIRAESEIREISEQIAKLPTARQQTFDSLVTKLRSISEHLSGAAVMGAMTAHRLSVIANTEAQKVDETNPMDSIAELKNVAALTEMANKASTIGLNLLAASKGQVQPDQAAGTAKQLTDDQLASIIAGGGA